MRGIPNTRRLASLVTAGILVGLVALGAVRFDHFATVGNLSNLLGDYAYVGIAAVGATFVIASGGIDLSIGSIVAFTAVATASLVSHGWHPVTAAAACVAFGVLIGATMGWLIHWFELPPFIVTLVGMFAVRAGCFLVSGESLGISHRYLDLVSTDFAWHLGPGATLPFRAGLLLAMVLLGHGLATSTGFGRNVFAIGGNARSARVMGVPIGLTTVLLYGLAGFMSALAGTVFAFYQRAGDPTAAQGLELTVIAAVVIGGTLLSGGVGSVIGTLLGVMILGVIRLLIDFQGDLNAAWTSIAVGGLLLGFVVMQRAIGALTSRVATGAVAPEGSSGA